MFTFITGILNSTSKLNKMIPPLSVAGMLLFSEPRFLVYSGGKLAALFLS